MAASDPAPSIAEQSVEQMGGRTTILARQRADHAKLHVLMARARATLPGGGRAHQVALRALARLVFTHAFAEEAVLFPAARRVLPEGDPLTLHVETDHQLVDEVMSTLDGSDWRDPGHAELLERAIAALHDDARAEEDTLLPRLQQRLSPSALRVLGWQWQLLRWTSPTRPHPRVSRRPPGQVLSALPLTVLDRARDGLQQLDEVTGGRFGAALSIADGCLAAAAGRVERLPLLQRGEHPETHGDPSGDALR